MGASYPNQAQVSRQINTLYIVPCSLMRRHWLLCEPHILLGVQILPWPTALITKYYAMTHSV